MEAATTFLPVTVAPDLSYLTGPNVLHRPGRRLTTICPGSAGFLAARLQPGQTVELPDAPYLHLFVPVGAVVLEGAGPLGTGDAVRFTATGGQRVTATEAAEVLVWEMHAGLAA